MHLLLELPSRISTLWTASKTRSILPGLWEPILPFSISSSMMLPLTSKLIVLNNAISTTTGQITIYSVSPFNTRWKANLILANKSKTCRSSLAQHLIQQQPTLFDPIELTPTPQHIWDWVKDNVKQYKRSYQLAENNSRAKELKWLQK